MLPAVTAEQALRWRRRVPRWALSLAVAVPMLVLVLAETVMESTSCTPQDPCRLPLDTLAYHLVPVAELLAIGTVVLALVLPRAAVWVAALAAALLAGPVAVDSSFPWLWRWALVWFVVVGAVDLLARWQQQVESASWQAPQRPYPQISSPPTDRLPRDEDTRLAALVVAGLAVVLAGGLFAWHLQATASQQQREQRSTPADATVTQVSSDGYTVTLDVQGRRVRLEPDGTYDVGESVPVLVDAQDPSHVELVAEPDDPSWRIGVAALLLVALLGLAARLWSRGARRHALLHRGGPAVRLRVGRDGGHLLLTTLDDPGFARPLALVRDVGPSGLLLPLSALPAAEDDELHEPDPHAPEPPDVATLSDDELAAWADGMVESEGDAFDDDVPPPPPVPRVLDGGAPTTVIGLRRDGDPVVLELDDAPALVSMSGVVDPWTWGRVRDRVLRLRPRERGRRSRPAAPPTERTTAAESRPGRKARAGATALHLLTPVATPLAYLLALAVYPAARWFFDGEAGWGALFPLVFGGSTLAEGLVFLAGLSRPPLGVRPGALLHRGRWMDELIAIERIRGVTAGGSSVVLRLADPDDALALPPQAVARYADAVRQEPTPQEAAFAVEQLLRTTSPSGRQGWRRPSVALVPGAIAGVGLLAAWAQAHFG
ncbi:MAG TPA: DUF3592 domain-containing protein [Angustibacter sp.]|nr:DUF3592 domain-containing protein [Angustibacter sp.]